MSSDHLTGNKILLLTNNLIEAADLTEQIEEQALGSVVTLRSFEEAVHYLDQEDEAPALVIFGLDDDTDVARSVLDLLRLFGCPIMFIDSDASRANPTVISGLTRPFSSTDVDVALRALGFGAKD